MYKVCIWDYEWNFMGEVEQGWRPDEPDRVVFPLSKDLHPIVDFVLKQEDAQSHAWRIATGIVFDTATGEQIKGEPPRSKPIVLTVECGTEMSFATLREHGTKIMRPWGQKVFYMEFDRVREPVDFRPRFHQPA